MFFPVLSAVLTVTWRRGEAVPSVIFSAFSARAGFAETLVCVLIVPPGMVSSRNGVVPPTGWYSTTSRPGDRVSFSSAVELVPSTGPQKTISEVAPAALTMAVKPVATLTRFPGVTWPKLIEPAVVVTFCSRMISFPDTAVPSPTTPTELMPERLVAASSSATCFTVRSPACSVTVTVPPVAMFLTATSILNGEMDLFINTTLVLIVAESDVPFRLSK